MIYIVFAVLLYGILIFVHELGHFLAAKAFGVRVNEFSIGMGPCIFKKQGRETQYSLRIFPLGGFCAMDGEDGESDHPHSLSRQGFFKKFIIFVAGVVMTFLVGFLIVFSLYADAEGFYTTEIVSLRPEFATQNADVREGDTLYAINGERIYLRSDIDIVFDTIACGEDGAITVTVLRDGKKRSSSLRLIDIVDEEGKTDRAYGFFVGGVEKATFGTKLRHSWYQTVDFARLVRLSLRMLVQGSAGFDEVSGPIGVVSTIKQIGEETEAQNGLKTALQSVLYIGALLAVNLSVMNLLPLPALDGGQILFLVINQVSKILFRKEIPYHYLNLINTISFSLLMAFMILITFRDIVKLF